jgi:hypothetical protein
MIEGIRITLSTQQLKVMLDKKVEYHKGKANFYNQQVSAMQDAAEDSNNSGSYNPALSLKNKFSEHYNKAFYFEFLSDHLIPDETYILSENDLFKLELTERML